MSRSSASRSYRVIDKTLYENKLKIDYVQKPFLNSHLYDFSFTETTGFTE